MKKTDQRPDPKPRKYPHLWQMFLWHQENEQARIRHNLRAQACESGKSNLDGNIERQFEGHYLKFEKDALKAMTNYGQEVPIWDWLISIKGIGPKTSAQLCAQIDDISRSPNVSALWRYCGYAVIDGKAEKNQRGEKSHYNRTLKSTCWIIGDNFIKQQTPLYSEIYYQEKDRLRTLYPEKIKVNDKWKYNDGHLDYMARRKMIKIFLQHVWLKWRTAENLPISLPYAIDILKHSEYIEPNK